ncbi:MAG: STAS domain-containing protein [Isosphaeraceae bacterium]|nr:STAS domain-containing protein [Isosphaeraceae bacterium]
MLKPMVQVHNIDGVLVAEFWDCLRLVPAPIQDLRSHYESHIRARGKADIVVDLSGVGLAGSAALGHFVTLQKLIRQHGGRVFFCNVDPHVHESFRVSRLVSLFVFFADRDAALAAVRRNDSTVGNEGSDAVPSGT